MKKNASPDATLTLPLKLEAEVYARLLERAAQNCRRPSDEVRFMVTEVVMGKQRALQDFSEFMAQIEIAKAKRLAKQKTKTKTSQNKPE